MWVLVHLKPHSRRLSYRCIGVGRQILCMRETAVTLRHHEFNIDPALLFLGATFCIVAKFFFEISCSQIQWFFYQKFTKVGI
jgi:hypothetical protein